MRMIAKISIILLGTSTGMIMENLLSITEPLAYYVLGVFVGAILTVLTEEK